MASTDIFPLDPDYTLPAQLLSGVLRTPALSLRRRQNRRAPSQRVFTLNFRGRSTDELEQLRDWLARFEDKYFVFNHKQWINNAGAYLGRKFPVSYLDDTLPQGELVSPEVYDFELRLLEAVGETLQTADYPDPATGHAYVTQQEGEETATQGTWNTVAHANFNGGSAKENANTNTTDYLLLVYSGYGFELSFRKNPGYGKVDVLLDETLLSTVDLYALGDTASSFGVFSKKDAALGLHRVKLRATNTKNGSASGQLIHFDAMRYMP